jgi:hypothetical protein
MNTFSFGIISKSLQITVKLSICKVSETKYFETNPTTPHTTLSTQKASSSHKGDLLQ